MDALTLDQFAVFTVVVEEGSFAAAARRLNRAQSAITYAIQKLEEQSGVALFDRSAYRPSLTEAGRTLLPRAKRILDDLDDYRLQAREIAKGVEAELTLIVHAYTPPSLLSDALAAFNRAFPRVEINIVVEAFEAPAALREGPGDLGILIEFIPLPDDIERWACGSVDLVAVAAPIHPLAQIKGKFSARLLRDHTQLVHDSRIETPDSRDYGVHGVNRWRITSLRTKHDLILAGVGWGSMPRPHVANDLAAGRLKELKPDRWEGANRMPRFPLVVAHLKDKPLGPAGRWLVQHLIGSNDAAAR